MIPYLSIVKFSDECYPEEFRGQYPFNEKSHYLWFGEIPNMRGHCVVMDMNTREFYTGFHNELFTELSDDDDLV